MAPFRIELRFFRAGMTVVTSARAQAVALAMVCSRPVVAPSAIRSVLRSASFRLPGPVMVDNGLRVT